MKTIALASLLFSLMSPMAFAGHQEHGAKCACPKECKENCSKGKSQDCKCEECNCKKEKTCH